MGKFRIAKVIPGTARKWWSRYKTRRAYVAYLNKPGTFRKWLRYTGLRVVGRLLILITLLIVAIYCWSTLLDKILDVTVKSGAESAKTLAGFVQNYADEGKGSAVATYVFLVSLPFLGVLWHFRTRDTLTQEKRTLDLLNETLFHNASERLYHDKKQLRADGLLVLTRIRDEYPEHFLDRVNHVTDRHLDLSGVILSGADLKSAALTRANFTDATLLNANLPLAHLASANFTNAHLSRANLTNADLTNANLSGATLSYVNLSSAYLSVTSFTNANLTAAILVNAYLYKANLANANLTHANLTGANLSSANLSSANLSGAKLENANFRDARVSHARLPFDSREKALAALYNFDNVIGDPVYVGGGEG